MKALFCGTFDPITLGHINIIERIAALFDEVVVGVFENSSKNCMFTDKERLSLVTEATSDMQNVSAVLCGGLVSKYARENGIDVIVKGVRNARDYDYELEMAGVNRMLTGCETFLLPADKDTELLSSTMVRILHKNGESVEKYVPGCVLLALKNK